MKQKIFIAAFVVVTISLCVTAITLINCLSANKVLRKVVKQQATELSEANMHAGRIVSGDMYVGLGK